MKQDNAQSKAQGAETKNAEQCSALQANSSESNLIKANPTKKNMHLRWTRTRRRRVSASRSNYPAKSGHMRMDEFSSFAAGLISV